MFWMFVKVALLVLYILAVLGVVVMILTLRHDLKCYIKDRGIKLKPCPLSQRVAGDIKNVICIFCPIWNFIIFLTMISGAERILNEAIDKLMDRQIFDKEEE